MGDIRNGFPVAKAIHHIAVGIEFDVRWRLLRDFGFLVRHVIPINVILCVHAYTADLSDYPGNGFGQLGSTTNFALSGCACARQSTPKAIAKTVQNQILANSPISFFILPPTQRPISTRVNFHRSRSFACDSRYLDMSHGVRCK